MSWPTLILNRFDQKYNCFNIFKVTFPTYLFINIFFIIFLTTDKIYTISLATLVRVLVAVTSEKKTRKKSVRRMSGCSQRCRWRCCRRWLLCRSAAVVAIARPSSSSASSPCVTSPLTANPLLGPQSLRLTVVQLDGRLLCLHLQQTASECVLVCVCVCVHYNGIENLFQ